MSVLDHQEAGKAGTSENRLAWIGVNPSPRILDSARKHGISDDTIRQILATPIYTFSMRADPPKIAVLGTGNNLHPIEVVYVINDDGTQVVIHAMEASAAFINQVRRHRKESR